MREFELTLRLRNNLLKKRRLELGLTSCALAERIGISPGEYCALETLKNSPLRTARSRLKKADPWRPIARKIAAFYLCEPEELWPSIVLEVKQSEVVREIAAEEAVALARMQTPLEIDAPQEALYCEMERRQAVREALKFLTLEQQWVLRMRYEEGLTLRGVADIKRLSVERIRQIETTALNRLRDPRIGSPGAVLRHMLGGKEGPAK